MGKQTESPKNRKRAGQRKPRSNKHTTKLRLSPKQRQPGTQLPVRHWYPRRRTASGMPHPAKKKQNPPTTQKFWPSTALLKRLPRKWMNTKKKERHSERRWRRTSNRQS